MMDDRQYEQKALEALKKAVDNALERKSRLGQHAVVWRDEQTVRLAPEEYATEVSNVPVSVREASLDDEAPK
jgi:hypothetical protein